MTPAEAVAHPPAPPPHFRRGARPVRHQRRRADTVTALAAGLSGDALDYGAGWGDLTARLAPKFRRIVGVDTALQRVTFAAEEFAPIEFQHCAPDRLPFADATFDVVFSIVVLQDVAAPPQYLAECHRVLRPGGHLIVMIQNPESMWMTGRRLRGLQPIPEYWGVSRAEFRDVLTTAGFAPEAEKGFYDPPLDHIRTAGDVALALMNATGHLFGIDGHWSYVGYRCRRIG